RVQKENDFQVCTTEFPGHARYLAARAAQHGAEVVLAVGGDGTINEVINGLTGTETALAVLPAGTANDFAAQMRLTAQGLADVSSLEKCSRRRVDLVRVNNWHFASSGGFGLPCQAIERAEYLRRQPGLAGRMLRAAGSHLYTLALLAEWRQFNRSHGQVTIEHDHGTLICEPVALIVANQSTLGKSFKVAPDANNHDGRCDLVVIDRSSKSPKAVQAVASIRWPWLGEPENVIRLQTRRLKVICDKPVPFFGDGEIRIESGRFDVEVIPGALRVLIPPTPVPGRVRVPSRSDSHGYRPVYGTLHPVTIHRAKG
ncbi:MAG: hypothetical protein HY851_02560, partial [candidate division Zixibacteria bacterium]|nr:hypothetical protein [candidate division Zixibacteria bacterium]